MIPKNSKKLNKNVIFLNKMIKIFTFRVDIVNKNDIISQEDMANLFGCE